MTAEQWFLAAHEPPIARQAPEISQAGSKKPTVVWRVDTRVRRADGGGPAGGISSISSKSRKFGIPRRFGNIAFTLLGGIIAN